MTRIWVCSCVNIFRLRVIRQNSAPTAMPVTRLFSKDDSIYACLM